jgi:hypothetical protein
MVDGQGRRGTDHRVSAMVFLLGMLLAVGTPAPAFLKGADSDSKSTRNLLVLRGQILMPDGAPAARATVRSLKQRAGGELNAIADDQGRFELIGEFATDARIHAISADQTLQATIRVPAMYARKVLQAPQEIQLRPTIKHQVTVLADGQPVEGVRVAAVGVGADYRVAGLTALEAR